MFRKLLVVVEIVAQNSHLSTTFKGVIGGLFICFNVNRIFFPLAVVLFPRIYGQSTTKKALFQVELAPRYAAWKRTVSSSIKSPEQPCLVNC